MKTTNLSNDAPISYEDVDFGNVKLHTFNYFTDNSNEQSTQSESSSGESSGNEGSDQSDSPADASDASQGSPGKSSGTESKESDQANSSQTCAGSSGSASSANGESSQSDQSGSSSGESSNTGSEESDQADSNNQNEVASDSDNGNEEASTESTQLESSSGENSGNDGSDQSDSPADINDASQESTGESSGTESEESDQADASTDTGDGDTNVVKEQLKAEEKESDSDSSAEADANATTESSDNDEQDQDDQKANAQRQKELRELLDKLEQINSDDETGHRAEVPPYDFGEQTLDAQLEVAFKQGRVLMEKLASDEDFSAKEEGNDAWNAKKLSSALVTRRYMQLAIARQRFAREAAVVMLLDISPSCEEQAEMFMSIASGAIGDGIEIYVGPNGSAKKSPLEAPPHRFKRYANAKDWANSELARLQNEEELSFQDFIDNIKSLKTCIIFGDWDGVDQYQAVVRLPKYRNTKFYWFANVDGERMPEGWTFKNYFNGIFTPQDLVRALRKVK